MALNGLLCADVPLRTYSLTPDKYRSTRLQRRGQAVNVTTGQGDFPILSYGLLADKNRTIKSATVVRLSSALRSHRTTLCRSGAAYSAAIPSVRPPVSHVRVVSTRKHQLFFSPLAVQPH